MGANAFESDRRIGERMVDDEVAWLGKKMQELLTAYEQQEITERQPVTFEAVEQIWTETVSPALKTS